MAGLGSVSKLIKFASKTFKTASRKTSGELIRTFEDAATGIKIEVFQKKTGSRLLGNRRTVTTRFVEGSDDILSQTVRQKKGKVLSTYTTKNDVDETKIITRVNTKTGEKDVRVRKNLPTSETNEKGETVFRNFTTKQVIRTAGSDETLVCELSHSTGNLETVATYRKFNNDEGRGIIREGVIGNQKTFVDKDNKMHQQSALKRADESEELNWYDNAFYNLGGKEWKAPSQPAKAPKMTGLQKAALGAGLGIAALDVGLYMADSKVNSDSKNEAVPTAQVDEQEQKVNDDKAIVDKFCDDLENLQVGQTITVPELSTEDGSLTMSTGDKQIELKPGDKITKTEDGLQITRKQEETAEEEPAAPADSTDVAPQDSTATAPVAPADSTATAPVAPADSTATAPVAPTDSTATAPAAPADSTATAPVAPADSTATAPVAPADSTATAPVTPADSTATTPVAPADSTATAPAQQPQQPQQPAAPAAPAPAQPTPPRNNIFGGTINGISMKEYDVKPKDCLWNIARRELEKVNPGVTITNGQVLAQVKEFIRLNPQIKNPDLIYPNQKIKTAA